MKLPVEMKTLRRIAAIALCASAVGLADDSQVLRYDRPIEKNLKRLDHSAGRSPINNSFMTQALPLGNGRLGAMFSGHVDLEYLVFNDITLWMNHQDFSQDDIRFTTKDGTLYAFVLAPPTKDIKIKTLATGGLLEGEIANIELMGSSEEVKWKRSADALTIQLPKALPGKIVNCFRIHSK